MPGTAVISVDYALTPESRFPVAVQQLLDVYLHVASGNDQFLGFKAKNIVVVGDSCGAALTASLVVVLNEIRRAGQEVLMPKELVAFYAVFSLRNHEVAPSYYTSIFHPFLMPQVSAFKK